MPTRWIRVVPASALAEGLKAIRREAGVPEAFPADVLAEAEAAASAPAPERERVGIPFVTIDPPGARDLDQMLHIERRGDGYRVHYAIADPGVFITPGGALDRDTHARGGVRLAVPEQEVVQDGGGWTVHYRVPLASEEHNAQISLLTGTAAAALMLQAGVGILRTQPPPEERALARLRRTAAALGVDWPQGRSYGEFIRGLDPAIPAHSVIMHEATGVGRGATYTPFDGVPPAETEHFAVAAPYAHATAPLRRLQDRYVSECCLAAYVGGAPPDWVRAGLEALPAAMAAGARRANAVERGFVDLVEAVVLAGREGERFDAVVIDEGLVQLREPAVRGRLTGPSPALGSEVTVRLERADPATRTVAFAV